MNYVEKFLEFLELLLQENSLFFSLLTRNQKPRKMPCVVSTYIDKCGVVDRQLKEPA